MDFFFFFLGVVSMVPSNCSGWSYSWQSSYSMQPYLQLMWNVRSFSTLFLVEQCWIPNSRPQAVFVLSPLLPLLPPGLVQKEGSGVIILMLHPLLCSKCHNELIYMLSSILFPVPSFSSWPVNILILHIYKCLNDKKWALPLDGNALARRMVARRESYLRSKNKNLASS